MKKSISQEELKSRNDAFWKLYYENEDFIKIHQFSQYHFRVLYKGKYTCDVWPIRRKFYIPGSGGVKIYKSIKDIKDALIEQEELNASISRNSN